VARRRQPDPEPVKTGESTDDRRHKLRYDPRALGTVPDEVRILGTDAVDQWMLDRGFAVDESVEPDPVPPHLIELDKFLRAKGIRQ
jgi:hypothetical protein